MSRILPFTWEVGMPVSLEDYQRWEDAAVSGWFSPLHTWTYASANTFTIEGDYTALYKKGMKVRYKQGGSFKYGYVVTDSTYSSPDTTVTVTGGSDYLLTNSAITDNYLSTTENPIGFPKGFAYSPGGIAATNVSVVGRFYLLGGERCKVDIRISFSGSITFTSLPSLPIPVSADYVGGVSQQMSVAGHGNYLDSGSNYYPNGIYPVITTGGTVVNIRSGANGAAMSATSPITWANGDIVELHFDYPI